MSQIKHILLLTSLALFFLVDVPAESLSGELYLSQAEVMDTDGHLTKAERASASPAWYHLIKSIAKRRIDTSPLLLAVLCLVLHPCDQGHGHSCASSAAVVSQAIPLYQYLHVYRR